MTFLPITSRLTISTVLTVCDRHDLFSCLFLCRALDRLSVHFYSFSGEKKKSFIIQRETTLLSRNCKRYEGRHAPQHQTYNLLIYFVLTFPSQARQVNDEKQLQAACPRACSSLIQSPFFLAAATVQVGQAGLAD